MAYLCDLAAMNALDVYEGVKGGHYRRTAVEVETVNGERLTAEMYIAGPQFVIAESRPSNWYLDAILAGARQHDLPRDYIESIERLARGESNQT